MRLDKLTIKAQESISEAMEEASRQGAPEITSLHLLSALLEQEQGVTSSILQRLGVPKGRIEADVRQRLAAGPRVSGAGPASLSRQAQEVLDAGWKVAQGLKDEYLSTEHILIGMLEVRGDVAGEILRNNGVTKDNVLAALQEVRGTQRVTDPNAEETYDALTKYSRDLTQLARGG